MSKKIINPNKRITFIKLSILSFVLSLISTNAMAAIKGHIGKTYTDSGYVYVNGWACDQGINQSINVHLYVGGAAGSGQFIKSIKAERSNETAVNTACSTSSAPHRFLFKINKQVMLAHRGKKIHVHGISLSGNSKNLQITKSGVLSVENFLDQSPKGYVAQAKTSGSNVIIQGWTCQKNVGRSLPVKIYVDGNHSRNGGVEVAAVTASLSHEQAVTNNCGSSTVGHRFKATIPKSSLSNHVNKVFYARAFPAVSGFYSKLLTYSGSNRLPNFTVPLSGIGPEMNGDIIIREGTKALIDKKVMTAGLLKVEGQLDCPLNADRTLNVQGVIVSGKLACGTPTNRVNGKIIFNIRRGKVYPEMNMHGSMGMNHNMGHSMGERVFAVIDGGVAEMHGESSRRPWTRLKASVSAGNIIKVWNTTNWKKGDTIAIAPTGYDFKEAESFKIDEVISRNTYRLEQNIQKSHYGINRRYSQGDDEWLLKSSAEVANLTRQIVIKTADVQNSPEAAKYIGAHMMVMRGGVARIDNVEFYQMGQAGEMARYPFHWHKVGDANGQYIKNSSVHASFQRCITVHGTNKALVHNNVCFDHRGHGIFLEDGSEIHNRITHNLVIKSQRPYTGRSLLQSDHLSETGRQTRRFSPTAGYWISNPINVVSSNVSAGSQGTGFWMSFEHQEKCNPDRCSTPFRSATTEFNNNVAKSNRVGMTWDGVPSHLEKDDANNDNNEHDRKILALLYQSPNIPTLRGNQAMMGIESCFYTRTTTMNFDKTVTADCGWHHFHAFNNRITNSIMIGKGPVPKPAKMLEYVAEMSVKGGTYGIVMYDGPFELYDVHFENFSTSTETAKNSNGNRKDITVSPIGKIGGASKYVNRSRWLSFSPEPYKRIDLFPTSSGWKDYHVSQALLDIDGSLAGRANSIVTTKNNFSKLSGCSNRNNFNAIVCDANNYRLGTLTIHDFSDHAKANDLQNKFYFNTFRNNIHSVHASKYSGNHLHSKVNLVLNSGQNYQVDINGQSLHKRFVKFQTHFRGQSSGIIRIKNTAGQSCSLSGLAPSSSFSRLESKTTSGFISAGNGDLFIKLVPSMSDSKFTGPIKVYYDSYHIQCN